MNCRSFPFLAIFVCFAYLHTNAQNGPVNILSPEAAGFTKNGNIPVSTYTGAPGISVPLFTIQNGEISLPITLNYNPSGIQVLEEATWVGLGFNLDAGGQITRTVRGADDLLYQPGLYNYSSTQALNDKPLFSNSEGDLTQGYSEPANPSGNYFQSNTNVNGQIEFATKTGYDNFDDPSFDPYNYDWISDLYSFSAGKNSGKFVLDNNGVPMTLKKSNTKVSLINGNNFQVTGEDGLIYTYALMDRNSSMMISSPDVTSTWYLTQIQSANGNNTVTFQYASGSLQTNVNTTNQATISTNGQISTSSISNYTTDAYYYLTEIDFSGGKVVFQSSAGRTDVTGERELDAAILYDSQGTQIKKYSLHYSYFHSTQSGNPLLSDRLRLDSILINDDVNVQYKFSYNTDNIPSKTAGRDHWGYYNNAGVGIPQGIYQLPVLLSNSSVALVYQQFPGGDYEAHWPYTQAMILNQITYPTGGYSKFTYESNEFGNVPAYWQYAVPPPASTPPIMIYPVTSIDNGSVPVTGTLNGSGYNLYCHFYCSDPDDLYGFYITFSTTDGTVVLQQNLSQFTHAQNSFDYYLNSNNLALTGNLVCQVNSNHPNHNVSNSDFFQFFQLDLTPINVGPTSLISQNITRMSGGGLRIQKIVNGDGFRETTYKTYTYNNSDGSTSGVIMNYPVYLSDPLYTPARVNTCCYFSSNSVIGLSTSASGSYIGYGHVIETTGESDNNTGSTEYYYSNGTDAKPYFYGIDLPCLQTSENGLLIESDQYDVNHNRLSQLVNTYSNFDATWNYATGVKALGANDAPLDGNSNPDLPPVYFWQDYQLNYQLLSQTSTLFNSNNYQGAVQTTTQYQYAANSNPQKIIKSTSTGMQDQTEYRYANDFTPGTAPAFVQEMLNYNILGKPIEVIRSKLNGSTNLAITGTLNQYGTNTSRGLIANQYYLYTTTPLPWGNANFSSSLSGTAFNFNANYALKNSFSYLSGNVTDFNDQQLNTSYLWEYNGQYPVVKCLNATSSEFYAENFEENTAASVVTGAAHTGTKFYNGAFTVNWAIPDSRNYVISYWYRSGGVWNLAGPQPYTGPTLALSGGDAYDDIRIYPADAHMITYTYQPLVGMTSETDVNSRVTFYDYDGFGRLMDTRDQNGNMLKTFEYHYYGQ